MKKIFSVFALLLVFGCSNMIQNENGSEFIIRLETKPTGCTFLYKLEADVSVYSIEDAYRYLENRIAEQNRSGNAYWVVSQKTRQNNWVMFGPERSFVLTANVYDCPTGKKINKASY